MTDFFLCVNAGNIEQVFLWLESNCEGFDINLKILALLWSDCNTRP